MTRLRLFGWLLAALLLWLVGYPLLLVLREALTADGELSLRHLAQFWTRPDEWLALWRSAWIAALSVVLAALVGVPLAFLLERAELPGQRWWGALLALPVALPPLVGVIAFLFLYGESGILARALAAAAVPAGWRLTGPLAILLVHAYSFYVYFYLLVRAALRRVDASLLEASASLGASRRFTLFRVVLPMLRPALVNAALLVFMTALASFSAPYIFGGSFRVMSTQIVASKTNGDLAMAQVETMMLLLLSLLTLLLLRQLDRGEALVGGGRGVPAARRRIAGRWLRWAAVAAVAGATMVALLPHLVLLLLSFVPENSWTTQVLPPRLTLGNYHALLSEPERLRPTLNSLWMSAAATATALLLGFAGARVAHRVRGATGRVLEGLLVLPWAVPGTVLAIALATAFSVHHPSALRLLLIGTIYILPLAYLVRSLPVISRAIFTGLRQFDPQLEEAAAGLGAGALRRSRRVVLPLLRPALLAGATLAFATAMGDFVTSEVLYTYETRPIAIEILSSQRLGENGVAAAYGVLLMVLSSAVFALFGRETPP